MLADYAGTVLGAGWAERGYTDHFKTEHYELNPRWQDAIRNRTWFNPRHVVMTVVFSSALILLIEIADYAEWLAEGIVGTVLTVFAVLAGRHLSNVLIFSYVTRHPEQISGRVTMEHTFTVATSAFQYVVALIPVAIIAVATRNPYAIGGTIGILLLLARHIPWVRKAGHDQSVSAPPTAATDEPPA